MSREELLDLKFEDSDDALQRPLVVYSSDRNSSPDRHFPEACAPQQKDYFALYPLERM